MAKHYVGYIILAKIGCYTQANTGAIDDTCKIASIFHDQAPQKYETRHRSNSLPLDLLSDSLLIALRGPQIEVDCWFSMESDFIGIF